MQNITMTHHCNSTKNFYLSFRFTIFQCSDDDALQFTDEWFLLKGEFMEGNVMIAKKLT